MGFQELRQGYIEKFKCLPPMKKAFASAAVGAGAFAFGAVTTGLLANVGMAVGLAATIYMAVEIAMASHEGAKTDPNSFKVLANMLAFTAGFAALGFVYDSAMPDRATEMEFEMPKAVSATTEPMTLKI